MHAAAIRRARPSDLAQVEADVAALFAEDSGTRDATISQDWPHHHARAWLGDQIAHDRKILLVAETAGHAGYLAGEVLPPSAMRTVSVAVLISMYVRPHLRGHGIGRSLATVFRDWARALEAERLSVTAHASNTDAVRFYERQGFARREVQLESAVD
ncbi:GNAT family N-acetyltransferase [Glycomyces xiaoerkulensis]|uniref:GNAT family N-acetyltransferase n=1 Tax=Glycomyces xiaoerkulensis TaxID=2038139 RepID=UPI000C263F3C|nr:GNAT family N-acetyltransferase [Glycomyces xiaoerkulensis]